MQKSINPLFVELSLTQPFSFGIGSKLFPTERQVLFFVFVFFFFFENWTECFLCSCFFFFFSVSFVLILCFNFDICPSVSD